MADTPPKYAILGDIHANLEALTAVLEDARAQACTHYACVGDVVGYNANPRECLELVQNMRMPCVKGNHDEYSASDDPLTNFNPRAAAAILWTRQQLSESDKQWLRDLRYVRPVDGFSLVHATLDAPQRWGYVLDKLAAAASFTYQTSAISFFGHTHVPMAFTQDGLMHGQRYSWLRIDPGRKYFVNVGSVGEPRDGNLAAAYAIYNPSERCIELRRIPYDVATVEAKVRAAGLPVRNRNSVAV